MSTTIVRPRARRAAQIDVVRPIGTLRALTFPLSASIRMWIARSRQRAALRDLAERSDRDHLLDDIGLTAEQALRGSAKWFWQP